MILWNAKNKQLKADKEQILIWYMRRGWEDAYHAWSLDDHPSTAEGLCEPSLRVMLPLTETLKVPEEASISLHPPPILAGHANAWCHLCAGQALKAGGTGEIGRDQGQDTGDLETPRGRRAGR